jgi:hypothetical protein
MEHHDLGRWAIVISTQDDHEIVTLSWNSGEVSEISIGHHYVDHQNHVHLR